jgi:hypothetical protein
MYDNEDSFSSRWRLIPNRGNEKMGKYLSKSISQLSIKDNIWYQQTCAQSAFLKT